MTAWGRINARTGGAARSCGVCREGGHVLRASSATCAARPCRYLCQRKLTAAGLPRHQAPLIRLGLPEAFFSPRFDVTPSSVCQHQPHHLHTTLHLGLQLLASTLAQLDQKRKPNSNDKCQASPLWPCCRGIALCSNQSTASKPITDYHSLHCLRNQSASPFSHAWFAPTPRCTQTKDVLVLLARPCATSIA